MKEMIWDITDMSDLVSVIEKILSQLTEQEGATVLALHGDLGTGKTTFTQELAKALGVDEVVTSPTFVVMKNYQLTDQRWSLLTHIDAYRLDDEAELTVLGFAHQLAEKDTIMCIEWAEHVAGLLPEGTVNLYFELTGDKRTLKVIN